MFFRIDVQFAGVVCPEPLSHRLLADLAGRYKDKVTKRGDFVADHRDVVRHRWLRHRDGIARQPDLADCLAPHTLRNNTRVRDSTQRFHKLAHNFYQA